MTALATLQTPAGIRPRLYRHHRLMGEILVEAGYLSASDLRRSLTQKYTSGAPLGEILLENHLITQDMLLEVISDQWSMDIVDLNRFGPEFELLVRADAQACIRVGCVAWRMESGIPVIVLHDPRRAIEAQAACGLSHRKVTFKLAHRTDILATIELFFGNEFEEQACVTCPEEISARNWNLHKSSQIGIVVILTVLVGLVFVPKLVFWILFGWILMVNVSTGVFRLLLVAARMWPSKAKPEDDWQKLRRRKTQKLPRVTIMIGLLNEDLVLPSLLKYLAEIDYPRELLEVFLLLEEGDEITQKHLQTITPAREFDVIIVPKGAVKTKPRALNYGLNFAKGEIVGILDAEDRPNADQIRGVVEYLHNAPADVACVQGVLDFYNSRRNWLSRCFTIEYAIWFRVLLKGMQRLRLPIPLGGTTAYFRRDLLEAVGGWDAHNVTEDADLGMRLSRFGYRTEVMPQTTMEEANAQMLPWIKQRSRWIKGYMVTWIAHMRQPLSLLRDLGLAGFLTFNVLLLGGVTSYLSIPLLWALWIGAFGFDLKGHLGGADLIWRLAFLSMIFGQIIMVCVASAALFEKDKRGLIPWVFTLPIYWPLGAMAAFKALFEVFFAPYYWDKTKHGHQSDQSTDASSAPQITDMETSPKLPMETVTFPGSVKG